jgi:hypothetical protein
VGATGGPLGVVGAFAMRGGALATDGGTGATDAGGTGAALGAAGAAGAAVVPASFAASVAGGGEKRRTAVTAARTCSCPTAWTPAARAQRIDSAARMSILPGTPPEAACSSRAAFRENTRSESPPAAAMRWCR